MKKNNTTTAPEGKQENILDKFDKSQKEKLVNYKSLKAENEKLKEDVKELAEGYNKYFNKYHELSQENKKLKEDKRELMELLKWISRATNSPEIGIRCDNAIKKSNQ